MQVNINCAFGTFLPRTTERLIQPLFDDLARLCILPAGGVTTPASGRWRCVRAAGLGGSLPREDIAAKELKGHQMYTAFKK